MNLSNRFFATRIFRPDDFFRIVHLGVPMAIAAALSGCANFSPDGGMSVAAGIAAQELEKDTVAIRTPEDATSARTRVADLLRRPLTADAAVQIALLNNRGLQAAYNELGIAEAAMVQAGLPPNPSFAFSRISGSLESELEATVAANILALATLPARAEIAADQFRAAQLRAAEETLRVAADARRNFYRAVAAQELVSFLTQANAAAETAAKLAGKLGETGAMNKLDQARMKFFMQKLPPSLRPRASRQLLNASSWSGRWGFGGAISALGFRTPCRHCRNIPRPYRRWSRTQSVAELISRSRASNSKRSQSHMGLRTRQGSSICSSCLASTRTQGKASAQKMFNSGILDPGPQLKSRYSISARSACAKPSRPICWP